MATCCTDKARHALIIGKGSRHVPNSEATTPFSDPVGIGKARGRCFCSGGCRTWPLLLPVSRRPVPPPPRTHLGTPWQIGSTHRTLMAIGVIIRALLRESLGSKDRSIPCTTHMQQHVHAHSHAHAVGSTYQRQELGDPSLCPTRARTVLRAPARRRVHPAVCSIMTRRITRAFARLVLKIQKFACRCRCYTIFLPYIHHPVHYRKLCLIVD